jgi:1-acyl-sn-glycerol-3-phosphate acyltransferase
MGKRLARWLLRLVGWTVVMEPEELPAKYVLIGVPHTSNWDFPIGMSALVALGIKRTWVGKHTLFKPPLGWFMRAFGGVPLDRSKRHNFVEQVIAAFEEADRMVIALTPEGTRSHTRFWKTGFYYIALGARVPIVLGFIDYERKRVGFGPLFEPTGDLEADLKIIRSFYADKIGKQPEKTGTIEVRPREEA